MGAVAEPHGSHHAKPPHRALRLLCKIPPGRVVTYSELARVCDTSPRAIGRIMAGNRHPNIYPCYKVVASTGELRGYSGPGGLPAKERLLKTEGIQVIKGHVPQSYFYQFPI